MCHFYRIRAVRFAMETEDINHQYYNEGDKLFKASRFNEASKCFHLALEHWTEDWQALMALGNCYSEMHKHLKAEASFRNALDYCPEKERPAILFNLGNALYDLQKFVEAVEVYAQIPSSHAIFELASKNAMLAKSRLYP